MSKSTSTEEIAQALYTINRHAKAAPKPQQLYALKKAAIEKLLNENKAKKIGLHFSKNPKLSNQHSTLLIKVAEYHFHIPPERKDFKNLKHLGHLDESFRNPQVKMSLSQAKKIIHHYIGWKEPKPYYKKNPDSFSTYYTPSSLGQMKWPPTKKFYAPF